MERDISPARRKSPRFGPPPAPPNPGELGRLALELAKKHGFLAAATVTVSRPATYSRWLEWLAGENHGEMAWLERDRHARSDLDWILPFTKSVLCVARAVPDGSEGNVARYARGEDYHTLVRRGLHRVAAELAPACPKGTHFRVCTDTAPLIERDIAAQAGLGFIGKNGMLIIPGLGSHTVLGELLTDVDLGAPPPRAPEAPFAPCGSCTACLESCPGDAFLGAGLLDARKCLSYLTIEKRTEFTKEEARVLGGRIFGCDVCQDVCPWNRSDRGRLSERPAEPIDLDPGELVAMTREEFDQRFAASAIVRATHAGLVRNARAALGQKAPRCQE